MPFPHRQNLLFLGAVTRLQLAHLWFVKTFEQLDFTFQPCCRDSGSTAAPFEDDKHLRGERPAEGPQDQIRDLIGAEAPYDSSV
jgi:hypothetical protein